MGRRMVSLQLLGGLALILVLSPALQAGFPRPRGPMLDHWVRVDMLKDSVGPGLSAAMPVEVRPLRLVQEADTQRYAEIGCLPEGTAFREVRSIYELFEGKETVPIPLYEVAFPRPYSLFMKAMLQGANPRIYGDLQLGTKLDVLGLAGFQAGGEDLSSVLRLPFKVKPKDKLTVTWDLKFAWTFDDEGNAANDGNAFTVSFAKVAAARQVAKLGVGSIDVEGDIAGEIAKPAKSGVKGRKGWIEGIVNKACGEAFLKAENLESPTKNVFNTSLHFFPGSTASVDLSALVTSAYGDGTEPVEIDYHPYAEQTGIQTLSSFMEPRTTGVTMFLTALSMPDAELGGNALRRETVRAMRWEWLRSGTNEVPVVHAKALRESLLRATLPLWEWLAVNNAWAAAGDDTPLLVRRRLDGNRDEVQRLLGRPRLANRAKIVLDDCYERSYYHPFKELADHRYASTVYKSWKYWQPVKKGVFRRGTQEPNRTVVVQSLAETIAGGYCRPPMTAATARSSLTTYLALGSQGSTRISSAVATKFASAFSDLEWLTQSIFPTSGTSMSGAGSLLSTAALEACSLTPLLYPLRSLHKEMAGRRMVELVRTNRIRSIEGLPWSTEPPARIMFLDDEDVNQLEAYVDRVTTLGQGLLRSAKMRSVTTMAITTAMTSIMSHKLTGADATQIQTAQAFFTRIFNRDKLPIFTELRALVANRRIAFLTPDKGLTRAGRLLGWVDAPAEFRQGGSLIASLMSHVYTYIERVDFKTYRAQTAGNQDGLLMKKKKNRFFDDLRRMLVRPSEVPRVMLLRYLQGTKGYDLKGMFTRLQAAASALRETVVFRKSDRTAYAPPTP